MFQDYRLGARVSADSRAETHFGMHQIMEREAKWDVDERFVVPDLDQIVDGATVSHDSVDLISTYFDTADGDLRACGILVRRRDGDDDSGWQVKLPAKDGRIELHWPLSDRPPVELTNLLIGVTSGRPLSELATIRTTRERYRISTPERKAVLAELVDDHVRASVGDRLLAWREVEVELGSADEPPERLTKKLTAAGARPSPHASKLEHAVSFRDQRPAPARDSALTEYLTAQIDQIIAGDVGLRRRQDPIHDTRVAIRRLRSSLRVFRAALDQARIGDMDVELKWFAGLLGEVRDCQVQQRRFSAALDDIPDEMVLGPVRSRIHRDLRSIELPARTDVDEAMSGERYLTLMAMFRRWRIDPPLLANVDDGTLRRLARKAATQGGQAPRVGGFHRRRHSTAPRPQGREAGTIRRRADRTACGVAEDQANEEALQANSVDPRRPPGHRGGSDRFAPDGGCHWRRGRRERLHLRSVVRA